MIYRAPWACRAAPGKPMLAHRGMAQGEMVAEIVAGRKRSWDKRAMPAICFTDPEVVSVGLSPDEARGLGPERSRPGCSRSGAQLGDRTQMTIPALATLRRVAAKAGAAAFRNLGCPRPFGRLHPVFPLRKPIAHPRLARLNGHDAKHFSEDVDEVRHGWSPLLETLRPPLVTPFKRVYRSGPITSGYADEARTPATDCVAKL